VTIPRSSYCCTCGEPRGVAPVRASLSLCATVPVWEHKWLKRPKGFFYERQPELVVTVNVWRNGGSSGTDYICDDCLMLGLRRASEIVESLL